LVLASVFAEVEQLIRKAGDHGVVSAIPGWFQRDDFGAIWKEAQWVVALEASDVFKKNEGATTVAMKNFHVSMILQIAKHAMFRLHSACFKFGKFMGGLAQLEAMWEPSFFVVDPEPAG